MWRGLALRGPGDPHVEVVYKPGQVTGFGPGSGAIKIATGYEGGLILKADGTVWAWGFNANGSLDVIGVVGGRGAPVPVQVPIPAGAPIVDISMDNACHALAVRADGSLLSWGCDSFGQVGDGPDTLPQSTATDDLRPGPAGLRGLAPRSGIRSSSPVRPTTRRGTCPRHG